MSLGVASMTVKARPGRVRQTYRFIEAHRRLYSVEAMCRTLEVAVFSHGQHWTLGANQTSTPVNTYECLANEWRGRCLQTGIVHHHTSTWLVVGQTGSRWRLKGGDSLLGND